MVEERGSTRLWLRWCLGVCTLLACAFPWQPAARHLAPLMLRLCCKKARHILTLKMQAASAATSPSLALAPPTVTLSAPPIALPATSKPITTPSYAFPTPA